MLLLLALNARNTLAAVSRIYITETLIRVPISGSDNWAALAVNKRLRSSNCETCYRDSWLASDGAHISADFSLRRPPVTNGFELQF